MLWPLHIRVHVGKDQDSMRGNSTNRRVDEWCHERRRERRVSSNLERYAIHILYATSRKRLSSRV